jgi:beta-glucanase (GH16 family)
MKIKLTLLVFLFTTVSFSQVDVVYSNLVWSDEFNANGAVNANNWFHQTQIPAGGSWFNGEVQHYTDQLANSYVNNGNLNIVAIKEQYTSQGITKQYTSARLNSKFAFKYGRVDIRAKAPNGSGTWPALWLLGKNVNEDGGFFDSTFGTTNWPACGELDIMEHGIFPNQPINYVGSAIHTTSSFGNTIDKGGIQASDIAANYHVYSMNWSPFEITFLLDNVPYYTYNPAVKNASTWPFDNEQYLLLNVAMGGFAGTIPANFTQATMEIDYVRVYQNTLVDTQAPTNFTATVGTVTSSTIELLLNSDDNSGNVMYTIVYNGQNIVVAGQSGVQKSVVIPNLNPTTTYSFTLSASDLANNNFTNNPINLSATTLAVQGCSGAGTQAQEGTFSIGYNYTFETIGTDVKITFEMLDTDKAGVVAFLRRQTPFQETQMSNVSGNRFTQTITNQTIGNTINYAVKFAYAGGLSVTNYIPYIVGANCNLDLQDNDYFEFSFVNPVKNEISISSNVTIDTIELFDLVGKKIMTLYNKSSADVSALSKGIYILRVTSNNKIMTKKIIKE